MKTRARMNGNPGVKQELAKQLLDSLPDAVRKRINPRNDAKCQDIEVLEVSRRVANYGDGSWMRAYIKMRKDYTPADAPKKIAPKRQGNVETSI